MDKKRIVSKTVSSAVLLSLVLTGCSSSNSTDNDGTSAENTAQTNDAAKTNDAGATNGEKPKEKVTTELWVYKFEDYNIDWYTRYVDEYNKTHENHQVNLTVVPGDAWDTKIKAAQAAGNPPDIWNTYYGDIGARQATGQILGLDQYTTPDIWNDLLDNVNKMVSIKGDHYAFPMLVEPSVVLFYRKDLFKEAGLDPEKAPVTWDELFDYAKKLTTGDRFGLQMASKAYDYSWTNWGLQVGHLGHRVISDDWSKATVADEQYLNLLNFYKRFYDAGVVPKESLGGIKALAESKVAMQISGSWEISELRTTYKDMADNVGVAVMPSPDGDYTKATATLGGWTLVVDSKSKHPQEAADFLSWFIGGDPKIMMDFFQKGHFAKFPTRKSVNDLISQDPASANDEWRKLITDKIVQYAASEPLYPWEVSFAFGSAVERSLLTGQDPMESLKQAEKEINDIIKLKELAGTNPALQTQ
ncbi:extracellular solute-binding protein [Paenibacillus montanisoli]|uniref:Sugar ABC transporter substrate-binding protein n=1 Tax=Paenibacillus montanisoli TaxID=2081970 RepID=A0A328U2F0_9BACL|nr:extracellular solute-binding protein [Paenibacillus montanisoli]RAP74096.1 sugar ABC transporter substrate-binding protein [Paenibacillus montanisoli]